MSAIPAVFGALSATISYVGPHRITETGGPLAWIGANYPVEAGTWAMLGTGVRLPAPADQGLPDEEFCDLIAHDPESANADASD